MADPHPHITTASGVTVRRRRSALSAARDSDPNGRPERSEGPEPSAHASEAGPVGGVTTGAGPSLRSGRQNGAPAPGGRIAVRPRRSRLRAAQATDTAQSVVPPEAIAWAAAPASRPLAWVGTLVQALCALACWVALAAIVYWLDPGRGDAANGPARAAFVLALFAAIGFTMAPLLRAFWLRLSHSRVFQEQSSVIATRQALMLAAFVALNALLQMVRAWSALAAVLLFGMLAVIEIVALARR